MWMFCSSCCLAVTRGGVRAAPGNPPATAAANFHQGKEAWSKPRFPRLAAPCRKCHAASIQTLEKPDCGKKTLCSRSFITCRQTEESQQKLYFSCQGSCSATCTRNAMWYMIVDMAQYQ